MTAVYKRELRSYFNSMIGYVFIAVVLSFMGIYFTIINIKSGYPYFSTTLANTFIIFVFTVPLLTMKSMAEERKLKTDQLLLTAPVAPASVILGKFFAMMTVYAIPLVISCLCPIIIITGGSGSLLIDYSTIFAFLCMGFMFVAIGMYISSLTESQIIAAIVTMGALLVIYLWTSLVNYLPTTASSTMVGFFIILAVISIILYNVTKSSLITFIVFGVGAAANLLMYFNNSDAYEGLLKKVFGVFSVSTALTNFATYHVFDLAGVVLFLSVAALFVFLTVQTLQKRRWN